MKAWNAAELVELNINETANGEYDFIFEFTIMGSGVNNDMVTGNDTPGSEPNPGSEDGKGESVTPDTLS